MTEAKMAPGQLARAAAKAAQIPPSELCGHHEEFERRIACIDRGNHDHEHIDGAFNNEAARLSQADRVQELRDWWAKQAESDVDMVAGKAVAYGSNSLTQLGRKLAQLQGREVTTEEAQELGCWINLVQKIERLTDSVMRGERASDDSITDAICYLVMTRRIRERGSWPGV